MAEPYIGQIEIFGFNFPPKGYAFAAGQLVAIQQNSALFALIGTNFGGNGTTNFQLPNFAARQGCSSGAGAGLTPRTIGETFGAPLVTLVNSELPSHTHTMNTYIPSDTSTLVEAPPMNGGLGAALQNSNFSVFAALTPAVPMSPMMIQPSGGTMPHNNLQPFLGLNYSIALEGVFPAFS